MTPENVTNEKEKRERFHTCKEDSVEEMERFFDDREKEIENNGSENEQNLNTSNTNNKIINQSKKRGRPSIKISEKAISKKIDQNRNKKYGFVQRVPPRTAVDGKSPPAKAKRIEVIQTEETEEHENEDEANEVFVNESNDNDVEEYTPNKKCIDCEQMYCDVKNDKAKKKCKICKSYEHGCIKDDCHEGSKGDTWLCIDCLELTNMIEINHPNLFTNIKRALVKKGMKKGIKRKRTDKVNEIEELVRRNIEESQSKEMKVSSIPPLNLLDVSITDEDTKSLEEGQWISDSIIALWFKYLQDKVHEDNANLLFIPPSVTQVLKEGLTDDFNILLEPLNIWQKKYIFMAVNDNKSKTKPGGQHWSLLIYTIKENLWYHYDSLNCLNLREARYLVGRVQDYLRPGATPKITEAICTQQDNSYDCGAYTMAYAQEIAERLAGDSHDVRAINKCLVEKSALKNLRNEIREMISTKSFRPKIINQIGDIDNKKTKTVTPSNVNKPPDYKDVRRFPNMNRDQICRFLAKGTCRHGAKGENELGKCNRYHPNQCKDYNKNGTTENGCRKGNKCNNWHATYICQNSIYNNVCTRVNCSFKHLRNCTTTNNDDKHFLVNNHGMPRQYRGPKLQTANNRQPYQQQRQQHHQQHRQHRLHMNNHWPPAHQKQHQYMGNQWPPQAQEERLMHLIREFLRGERAIH